MTGRNYVEWSTCEDCGKRSYMSRKTARRVARRLRPNGGRVHAYRCATSGAWHIGHVPTSVKDGRVDRREYGSRRS